MALEELNTFLGLPAMMWFVATIAVAVGFVILIAVHEIFLMNSFSKAARSMKRGKGLWALIQENNVLHLVHSTTGLPEGLYEIRGKWFMRPQTPYLGTSVFKRPVGRPKKTDATLPDGGEPVAPQENVDVLKPDERQVLQEVLQVPILDGVGKPLFVGCINQPLLTNIKTVAHADLTRIREVIPLTLTQTQLDALATYSKMAGIKRAGKDTMKLIYLAIVAAIIIGSLGIVAYMLTQPRQAAAAVGALVGLSL